MPPPVGSAQESQLSGAQFVNRSAQEHLLYIQEKVNPILEALVTAVLLERPEEPTGFMLNWLCEQTKTLEGNSANSQPEIETVRAEIARLKERKVELLAEKTEGKVPTALCDIKSDKSTKADDDESEEESDDPDAPDMPPPLSAALQNRGPRQSVSAEAYGAWNTKKEFTAPVYEKTDDQKERIQKTLCGSFLFNALEQEDMSTVILAFKERLVEPDVRLIEQGDDGDSMFLIEAGVAECLKKIDGEEKVVKTCVAGDVFGELALLYNCPRAATVVTREKMTLWELERETFTNIVKDAAQRKRDIYSEFLKKIPLFANMDSYETMTVADALQVTTISEDTQIIKQGDHGDKFFIILEGECVAKKAFITGQESVQVMTHKAGDYFGELAIIKNEPRAASIFASAGAKLLTMERKTFQRLMGPIAEILRRESSRYDAANASASGSSSKP